MPALLWSIVGWLVREVLIKFIALAVVFALITVFMPMVFKWLAPFIKTSSLTAAWASVPAGVWWLLDAFKLDVGVPLLISAWVARFMIRRLPVVG